MKSYRYVAVLAVDADKTQISFPDLPGCVATVKKNDDVYKHAQTILALHLSGMEQDGEIIPAPSRVKLLAARKNCQGNEIFCTIDVPSLKNFLDTNERGIIPFTKDDVDTLQSLALAVAPFLVFSLLTITLFFSIAKMIFG